MKIDALDLFHYVVVFGALLASWSFMMGYTSNIAVLAVINFFVFILADKIAHRFILGDKT